MSERYTHDQGRRYRRDPNLRAADDDREAIASVLREQHLAGRLATDEFQERLDRCYAAKTYGELDELVADLPASEPDEPAPRPWSPRPWRVRSLPVVALVIAAIVLSHGFLLWLAFPLFFFVWRPLMWRSAGRRYGWGYGGCGFRHGRPPSDYV
jgi:hypothetical protein